TRTPCGPAADGASTSRPAAPHATRAVSSASPGTSVPFATTTPGTVRTAASTPGYRLTTPTPWLAAASIGNGRTRDGAAIRTPGASVPRTATRLDGGPSPAGDTGSDTGDSAAPDTTGIRRIA